jgi:hypothetical protein
MIEVEEVLHIELGALGVALILYLRGGSKMVAAGIVIAGSVYRRIILDAGAEDNQQIVRYAPVLWGFIRSPRD